MKQICSVLFLLLCQIFSAQMPDSDIWLFQLELDKTQQLVLKSGKNITNRKGYDNQPSISKDGKKIFFSSVREDGQADVYVAETKNGKIKPLLISPESEYSPTPFFMKGLLSTVLVEKDSAQRIYFMNEETGQLAGRLLFDSVGYHCFLNEDTVIYFKLTQPFSLRYHVRSLGEDRQICVNPIRSIKMINRHCVLFGIKDSLSTSYYKYEFFLRKAIKLASCDSISEDIIWLPSLGLLRSEGTRILRYNESSGEWDMMYDLKLFGLEKIARFQLDLEHKLLVAVEIKSDH